MRGLFEKKVTPLRQLDIASRSAYDDLGVAYSQSSYLVAVRTRACVCHYFGSRDTFAKDPMQCPGHSADDQKCFVQSSHPKHE